MRKITPKHHPYELHRFDHGMGGPYDGKSELVGRFSTGERLIKYLTDKGYILKYPRKSDDKVIGAWYPADGKSYLGLITYDVYLTEKEFIFE